MLINISVSKEDSEASQAYAPNQHHPRHCPLAIAACRTLGLRPGSVSIVAGKIILIDKWKGETVSRLLPKEIIERITYYDCTGTLKPFEFEIELPA